MTDKQIIIDGVDVSGCEYCLKMTKYRCTIQRDVYKCLCEENPNCYFKQLARKTQECEELREYHNKCCEEFENEKKELLEKYNQLSRDFYSGKYCNVEKCKQLDQLKVENDKYEQTLIEIKEIAEENIRIADLEGLNGVYRRGLAEQILQKISEVEKNNNELY